MIKVNNVLTNREKKNRIRRFGRIKMMKVVLENRYPCPRPILHDSARNGKRSLGNSYTDLLRN